jgi:hypothetical protein
MFDKVFEVCGSCKGEFSFRGSRAWLMALNWRATHKCEGPALTYLFQSAEMPTWEGFDDDEG